MADFVYNNVINANSSHMPLKLNYGFYSYVFYKKDVNLYFKSKSANESLAELNKLMTVCRKNFYHTQKLQKKT